MSGRSINHPLGGAVTTGQLDFLELYFPTRGAPMAFQFHTLHVWYMPTLTPETTPMYTNMPYMECLGYIVIISLPVSATPTLTFCSSLSHIHFRVMVQPRPRDIALVRPDSSGPPPWLHHP